MKKTMAALSLLLAACSTGTERQGQHLDQLRQPDYLRTERNLSMTFPQIQMALFKHERLCGEAPVFRMKKGEASYATITEPESDEQPWNQLVLFDLMWLQPTLRYETRTRVYVYSFYSDRSVRERIDAIFNAVEHPERCPSD